MQVMTLAEHGCECLHFTEAINVEDVRDAVPGAFVGVIDGSTLTSKSELLNAIATTLEFPYFGHNWDALLDCLRDLEWVSGTGYVLVVTHALEMWRELPRESGLLCEIWLSAAASSWMPTQVPFHLVFVWGALTDVRELR
jgi:hypothetical protein